MSNPNQNTNSEIVAKEKKKPKRDPEKRRQQNVQAQKRYREKLRLRLGQLEAIAASSGLDATLAVTATAPGPILTGNSVSSQSQIQASTITSRSSLKDELYIASPSTTPQGECSHPLLQVKDASSACIPSSSTWDATTHLSPSLLIRSHNSSPQSSHYNYNTTPATPPTSYITTIKCGCTTPHVKILTEDPSYLCNSRIKILSFGPSSVPDLYANALRIEIICTTAALYHLGLYVGVSEAMICGEERHSSFFREGGESAVKTVQAIFRTMKPDLRPSREQITVDHHPFIDILPFPTVRRNLILGQKEVGDQERSQNSCQSWDAKNEEQGEEEPEFDEDEFFDDMLTGLVCWGGAGMNKRDRDDGTGFVATNGTPWEARSWEAKAWFVKKYWNVLGGEDGELVRQSEWWRGMRGEDDGL